MFDFYECVRKIDRLSEKTIDSRQCECNDDKANQPPYILCDDMNQIPKDDFLIGIGSDAGIRTPASFYVCIHNNFSRKVETGI
ncbi:hypothetical protein LMG24235_07292 [Paraburkholderia sabiae]|nr:hypothetical protein LMG24235_07292 [Paraburkholderia sabiae]